MSPAIDFADFSMLFRPSASTRSKNTRPAKNLKKICNVLQKSRFSVWAHASKIIRKSLRTRLSSETRHRAPSKNDVFEFRSAKMTSEVPLGCLGRLPGPLLGPSWPAKSPSWAALGSLLGTPTRPKNRKATKNHKKRPTTSKTKTLLCSPWAELGSSWPCFGSSWPD